MLRLISQPRTLCDGTTRRDCLRVGALSLFSSLTLPRLLQASEAAPRLAPGPVKSIILLNLYGGPSHIDTFDLKPDAPANIRGEFQPIATSLPGLHICEHLPRIAARMDAATLIRTHSHPYNSHNPYNILTGFTGGKDVENYFAKRTDHPSIGSVIQHFGLRSDGVPTYVGMPAHPGYSQSLRRAGPYGGYLGSTFDPLHTICSPQFSRPFDFNAEFYNPDLVPMGEPSLPAADNLADVTLDRLDRRRSLLQQFDDSRSTLDRSRAADTMTFFQREALELLTSPRLRQAFDLSQEPASLRDTYGRHLYGSSALLARRLVEAGTKFVTVTTESPGLGHWDTHVNNFNMLKKGLLPILDQVYSALIDDLADRGLLESTLVVTMGEMGRIVRVNGYAGRDHWPQCGFAVLTGAGVKQGFVFGKTDRFAEWPIEHPVSSADIVATLYHLLGLDPHLTVPDLENRPIPIAHGGEVITSLLR